MFSLWLGWGSTLIFDILMWLISSLLDINSWTKWCGIYPGYFSVFLAAFALFFFTHLVNLITLLCVCFLVMARVKRDNDVVIRLQNDDMSLDSWHVVFSNHIPLFYFDFFYLFLFDKFWLIPTVTSLVLSGC